MLLQKLKPNTPYTITVSSLYPDGEGGRMTGRGKTSKWTQNPVALKTKELTHLFTFGFSGSLMPRGLLSSCREQGLLSLCCAQASHWGGISCCEAPGSRALELQWLQLLGSRAQAQQLWCVCWIAPWHVGSSQIRARTCVFHIGILKVLKLYMSFESMNLLPEQCSFYAVRLIMLLIVN